MGKNRVRKEPPVAQRLFAVLRELAPGLQFIHSAEPPVRRQHRRCSTQETSISATARKVAFTIRSQNGGFVQILQSYDSKCLLGFGVNRASRNILILKEPVALVRNPFLCRFAAVCYQFINSPGRERTALPSRVGSLLLKLVSILNHYSPHPQNAVAHSPGFGDAGVLPARVLQAPQAAARPYAELVPRI